MPGGFTGNTSVNWYIDVDDARDGATKIYSKAGSLGRGMKHEGTEANNGANFVIRIKHPQRPGERDAFIDQLQEQLDEARGGSRETTFTIAVEDEQHGYTPPPHDQIKIDW